jgi:hypothetical protein
LGKVRCVKAMGGTLAACALGCATAAEALNPATAIVANSFPIVRISPSSKAVRFRPVKPTPHVTGIKLSTNRRLSHAEDEEVAEGRD